MGTLSNKKIDYSPVGLLLSNFHLFSITLVKPEFAIPSYFSFYCFINVSKYHLNILFPFSMHFKLFSCIVLLLYCTACYCRVESIDVRLERKAFVLLIPKFWPYIWSSSVHQRHGLVVRGRKQYFYALVD